MRIIDLHEIDAATASFSAARLVGKGSHGSVYKGILADGTLVAVKKQSSGLRKLHDNTKLENEARILSALRPNPQLIVDLVGVGRGDSGDTILVAEYLPNGTLHDLLHRSAAPPPTWRNRLEIALQLARAARFLHAPDASVVHRDIKPANILLDGDWNAKLADFGLAVRLDGGADVLPAGTIGYIDPNYTAPEKLSTKIDVYSYGVVLLELISGRKAIDVAKSPASVVEWALPLIKRRRTHQVCDSRVRLPPDMEGSVELLLGTAARCLSPVEALRPPMSEIVAELEYFTAAPAPIRAVPLWLNYIWAVTIMRGRKLISGGKDNCDLRSKSSIAKLSWVYIVNKYICGFDTPF
ncbi:serine/threonine-protein kinase-like protein At5g23170 [Andrographis paniculata]|uniref:serine/threonine-protein kinase-like protein At5g23170 n=1 Tax=Andrographis paniculata TaxID=175694 RepID=UPI0021E71981|nr:serine/threonine-protein kinase-like protein At5g23170 [Andrographis paniculata]